MNQLEANILIEARKKKGWTQTEMAEKLAVALDQGYSMRQYQKLEEGKFPKYKRDIVTQLDRLLGTNLFQRLYAQNIPHSANGSKKYPEGEQTPATVNEDQETDKPNNITNQALLKLADSNAMLSESNLSLARSHEKLVIMLEEKHRPTERLPQQKELMHQKQVSLILRVLAEVGTGKRWGSVEEAYAELNIILADPLGESSKAHSGVKAGK